MEVLIPLAVVAVVIGWSVKRFKPELWEKAISRFKK
jgi:hypothetical protein